MLATHQEYRGRGIATKLVRMAIDAMIAKDADEIALETEVDNVPSLRIYENLGFIRTKRLHRYYLSGKTAFRLLLYLKPGIPYRTTLTADTAHWHDMNADEKQLHEGQDFLTRQLAQRTRELARAPPLQL